MMHFKKQKLIRFQNSSQFPSLTSLSSTSKLIKSSKKLKSEKPKPKTRTKEIIKVKAKKGVKEVGSLDSCDDHFLETVEIVYEGCTVLTEDALITFPRFDDFHNGKTLCCGCCRFMVSSKARCSTCNLPLCGSDCMQISVHKDYECKIFTLDLLSQTMGEIWKNKKLRPKVYLLVAIFRCLSIKLKDNNKWTLVTELMKLSSSEDKSKCLSALEDLGNIGEIFLTAKQVVDAKQHGNYPALSNPPDHGQMVQVADIIVSISCILTKNGLTAWPQNLHDGMMALLYTTGQIPHDCNPNTSTVMAASGTIKLIASYTLSKGTRITIGRHLSQSVWFLQGFHSRQSLLNSHFLTHKFCSACSNCSDNNSGISFVRCSACNKAFTVPVEESRWRCVVCSHVSSEFEIRSKIVQGEDMVKKYTTTRNGLRVRDVEKLVQDISHLEETLSPSHFIVLALKMQYLKPVRQYRLKSNEFLNRVLNFGEQILSVLNFIMKGLSYYKGLLYFYMHVAHEILQQKALKVYNAEVANYHRNEMLLCIMQTKKNWSWRKNFTALLEEQEFYAIIETHSEDDFCVLAV